MRAVDKLLLTTIVVPPHTRVRDGQVQHVDGYTYERDTLPEPTGDCYNTAIEMMMEVQVTEEHPENFFIVQGTPLGTGPIAGIRFGHAWVEEIKPLPIPDDAPDHVRELFKDQKLVIVHDHSNGNEVDMLAELYYAIGNISQDEVRRYSYDDMFQMVHDTGKAGPWEDSPVYGPINTNSLYI